MMLNNNQECIKDEYYISYNELLNKNVLENGYNIFVKTHDDTYTWLDIDKGANIIESDLKKIGITSESRVGIYCSNSINWIITFFAICKLGATPFLLNNKLSINEIISASYEGDMEYLCYEHLDDKDHNLFVNKIKKNNLNKIKEFYLINNKSIKDRFNEPSHIKTINNDDKKEKSIILLSSGSTGVPKVVLQSQNMMVYCAKQHANNLKLNQNDKHCLALPLFHIFGLYTVLLTSAVNNCQIVIPEKLKTSSIISAIEKERCTALNVVPTLLLAILASQEFSTEKINSIRYTIIGGAMALPKQIELFRKQMPSNHIMNSYGLTENYHISITDYNDLNFLNISVGRPYEGVEILIKNQNTNKICNVGEIGEVLIKGFNMIGYYNFSESHKYLDDKGWFYTGDLGYIDKKGNICLTGRIKDIIIRSGETIAPAEIELALSNLEEIKEVKVFGIPDDFRGEEIAACIILNDGSIFDEKEVKLKSTQMLASYKIPKYFYVFKEFPKLGTGKIDVSKLKEMASKTKFEHP